MSSTALAGPVLVLLVGPKGAGKSTLGRALERQAGIVFFEVERHWLAYRAQCEAQGREPDTTCGQRHVLEALAEALTCHGVVCAETTGADAEVLQGYRGAAPTVFIVGLQAPLELCLARVASRDPAEHLPSSAELVGRVHHLSEHQAQPVHLRLDSSRMSPEAAAARVADALCAFSQRPGGSGTNC